MSVPGNDGMEKLIPIINELHDACTKNGLSLELDLPQIAVVGSQSAGKSSVLENIVGRDFLPRGSGIVTRRPLILKLTNEKKEKEYGEFLHCQDKRFEDFDEIRAEIKAETDRTTGTNKGISDDPINLEIFSPRVLNLTLVDLPGITKVPIGDQPPDIEKQIKAMILKYISQKNCLILAVTPGNTDLANSDALKLAREVDPEGTRTIGVITKLDLMDKGTDAQDVLENRVFPLQRGYIGVVNRSQMDVEGNKDIQAALKTELDFFVDHPSYNHMADRCGTSYLQTVLNRELTEHICKSMPNLQEELQKKITLFEGEVGKFKGLLLNNSTEMRHTIFVVAQKLSSDFKNSIGAFGQESVETDKLSSGAKINQIFHERLAEEIAKIEYDEENTMDEIDITIRNIHGIRTGLYQPPLAFEIFTEQQIGKLKSPIMLIITLVIEELKSAVRKCTQKIIFPKLRDYLRKEIIKYVDKNTDSAIAGVLALIDIEMSYINTKNLVFDQEDKSVKKDKSDKSEKEEEKSSIEKKESAHHEGARDIFNKLKIYTENVKQNMKDQVPKAITCYIIKELVKFINEDVALKAMSIPVDEYPEYLKLNEMDRAKYVSKSKMLVACKEALAAIHDLYEQTNALGTQDGNKSGK